jgi:trehalose 6-phosphate phosphatase
MLDQNADGERAGDPGTRVPDSVAAAPALDWALFLDLDGTLLDIAATPDTVEVPPELPRHLARVASRLGGALAIVSGRRVADIDGLLRSASFTVAGQHGGELRRAGDPVIRRAQAQVTLSVEAREHIARAARLWPGVIVEEKELGLAVHYRLAPWARNALGRAVGDVAAASGGGLRVLDGDRVWEIMPAAFDKGTVVEALMATPPFIGRRPVFVGDDVTDEDGFAAALRLGGGALRVGDRLHAISATARAFAGAADVRAWLAAFAMNATA